MESLPSDSHSYTDTKLSHHMEIHWSSMPIVFLQTSIFPSSLSIRQNLRSKPAQKQNQQAYTWMSHIYVRHLLPYSFYPVDVHLAHTRFMVVGIFPAPNLPKKDTTAPSSLSKSFPRLHPSLQDISGSVHFPSDDGFALISALKDSF